MISEHLGLIPESVKTDVSLGVSKFGKNIGTLNDYEKSLFKSLFPRYKDLADRVDLEVNPVLMGSALGAVTGASTISFPSKKYRSKLNTIMHEYMHLIQVQRDYGGDYKAFLRDYNSWARDVLERESEAVQWLAENLDFNTTETYEILLDYYHSPEGFFYKERKITFLQLVHYVTTILE